MSTDPTLPTRMRAPRPAGLPLPKREDEPIREEHYEAGLTKLAFIVTQPWGAKYLPLYEKLEAGLIQVRSIQNPLERARRRLASQTIEGAVNSIF